MGVVLAGGASRRLGGAPKGLELIGGTRIIDRVVSALGQVTGSILLAANDPKAITWLDNVAVVSDKAAHSGGLAGVYSALSISPQVLVVAWDMPFVSHLLLQALATAATTSMATAVVPESPSPHGVEPFCALYSRAALAPLDEFLSAGAGAAHTFLQHLPGVVRVPLAEVSRFGDPRRLFFSVNTAEDLALARAMADEAQ